MSMITNQHSKLLDLDTAHKYPDTLTSTNNLALVLSGQGEHAQAEEMRRQVLGLGGDKC